MAKLQFNLKLKYNDELLSNKVNEFEDKYKIKLPLYYKKFLIQNNGGRPNKSFFWIKKDSDGSSINNFFGIHGLPEYLLITSYYNNSTLGINKSLLPIADDGLGNFICLGIAKNIIGKIFFLDHDYYKFGQDDNVTGIYLISESLNDFLHSLIKNIIM